MGRVSVSIAVILLALCSGCSSLLPSERAEVLSPFADYLDAEQRFGQAVVGKTSRAELFSLGFDPLAQGNCKMLSFIDVRLLFVQPNIPLDYLPDGLLQCLQAKDRCIGYAFDFNKTDTQRVGSTGRSHRCDPATQRSVASLTGSRGTQKLRFCWPSTK